MNRIDILNQINNVFISILGNKDIRLSEKTTAFDIEGWDSLTHIQLVVAIEKHFNIRFTSKEIRSWNNLLDMINSVNDKLT